jgi:hypothetical protein
MIACPRERQEPLELRMPPAPRASGLAEVPREHPRIQARYGASSVATKKRPSAARMRLRLARNLGWIRRFFACRSFGHGSGK